MHALRFIHLRNMNKMCLELLAYFFTLLCQCDLQLVFSFQFLKDRHEVIFAVLSFLVSSVRSTLQKQQSLPVRPIIPLVARISDQNASGAPPMTVREKSRLDKFKYLLSCPNTDLGETKA